MAIKDEEKQREEARKKAVEYVIKQFKEGVPKETIIARLTQNGAGVEAARSFVESIHGQLVKEADKEEFSTSALVIALVAAFVAAIIGGAIWGGIVILTNYEIGFMATGIGLLCGFAVTFFTEKKGLPLQIIAVFAALAGILVGKYLTFFSVLKDILASEFGAAAASQVGIFSSDVVSFFFESFGDLLSFYDLLWVALAILAAWSIPRAVGARKMKLGAA
jgi:hypothetical protein